MERRAGPRTGPRQGGGRGAPSPAARPARRRGSGGCGRDGGAGPGWRGPGRPHGPRTAEPAGQRSHPGDRPAHGRAQLHERLVPLAGIERSLRARFPWTSPSPRDDRRSPTSSRASVQSRSRWPRAAGSPRTAKRRERTRATFPSTAAAGSPKAMEATAPAVYGPNPGSARRAGERGGQAAVPPQRQAGRRQEVAAAGVVAEAAPGGEHLVVPGGGQRPERGPALDEAQVVRDRRQDPRLLEHHLGEPYAVRIGSARRGAPGQLAVARAPPGQEAAAERGRRAAGDERSNAGSHPPTIP